MIRYGPLTRQQIEDLIDRHDPTWRAKAADRTKILEHEGRYLDGPPDWGDVKLVFMRLQNFKCAFCERPLARAFAGSIEHDVEHFRPKGSIKAWPRKTRGRTSDYDFNTGDASASGYHWLAFEVENYATACKPCNTIRKSNCFPIEQQRGKPNADIRSLNASEQPLLIFPIGEIDDDPSDLITFEGIVAVPRHKRGRKHRRARITIDFFALNEREELWEDRFRAIALVYMAMEVLHSNPDPTKQAAARRRLGDAVSDNSPHASCARAFLATMTADYAKAWTYYTYAEAALRTTG